MAIRALANRIITAKHGDASFVASPEGHIVSDDQRTLIEQLLRERISLRSICRAVGVSLPWLLHFIERFNNTLRQRLSRLVRELLSFSKILANHIGALRYFICHYNLTRAAALPV